MINSKNELKRYMEMDAAALGLDPMKHYIFGKEIWKFQKCLRKYEYCINCCNVKPIDIGR